MVSRTILADANELRDWRIDADLAQVFFKWIAQYPRITALTKLTGMVAHAAIAELLRR